MIGGYLAPAVMSAGAGDPYETDEFVAERLDLVDRNRRDIVVNELAPWGSGGFASVFGFVF